MLRNAYPHNLPGPRILKELDSNPDLFLRYMTWILSRIRF